MSMAERPGKVTRKPVPVVASIKAQYAHIALDIV
jgi:hypothetical protein